VYPAIQKLLGQETQPTLCSSTTGRMNQANPKIFANFDKRLTKQLTSLRLPT